MQKFNLAKFAELVAKHGIEARDNNNGFKVLEDLGNVKMRIHSGKNGFYGFVDLGNGKSVLIGIKAPKGSTLPEGDYVVNIKLLELLKDYEGKQAGYVWFKGYIVVEEAE